MGLGIPTDRALRSPGELRALVDAVEAAAEQDEADWIEWKSAGLDLTRKEIRATLARHIIGMANRRVDEAARTAAGHGYLLVGVQPGDRAGVTAVDLADLDAGVERYLGPDSPRWTATYDTLDGVSVLVIIVDPPRHGDPIHVLHRDFDRYQAGDIFVRRKASTHRANPGEIRYLQQRACQSRQRLGIQVHTDPEPILVPQLDLEPAINRWVEQERARILATEPGQPRGVGEAERLEMNARQKQPREQARQRQESNIRWLRGRRRDRKPLSADDVQVLMTADLEDAAWRAVVGKLHINEGLLIQLGLGPSRSRTLTPEQDAADLITKGRASLRSAVRQVYYADLAGCFELAVLNTADSPSTDVQVMIQIAHSGGLRAIEPVLPGGPPRVLQIDNETPLRITYPPVTLRPYATIPLRFPVHLIASEPPGTELIAQWSATALDAPGRPNGEFIIRVGDPIDVDGWFHERLTMRQVESVKRRI